MTETLAVAAAWLAHLAWYAQRPQRLGGHALAEPASWPRLAGCLAVALALLSLWLWIAAHGLALGACGFLLSASAAGSAHTLAAPLFPRLVLLFDGCVALGLLVGGVHAL